MSSSMDKAIPAPTEIVCAAVGHAADLWAAQWDVSDHGGTLRLPVVRGLRHGIVSGEIAVAAQGDSTILSFSPRESHFQLNWAALGILVFGAAGALVSTLWPFFPALLRLAPAGVILAIAAWLLVAARLRSSDVSDFLGLVADLAAHADDSSEGNSS